MLHLSRRPKSLGATADTDADSKVLRLLQVMPVASEVNCGVSNRILMLTEPLLLCTRVLCKREGGGGGEGVGGGLSGSASSGAARARTAYLRLKPNTAPSKCKPTRDADGTEEADADGGDAIEEVASA
jgi:hypothetical protein